VKHLPPLVSARVLFWTGLIVVVGSFLVLSVLPWAVYYLGGSALGSRAFQVMSELVGLVVGPLGIAFLAVSFIGFTLERRRVVSARRVVSPTGHAIPSAVRAPILLLAAAALITVGVTLTLNLGTWMVDLAGRTSILGDLLGLFGGPLEATLLPLGIVLVPVSFIVRMLDAETDERAGHGAFGGHPPVHPTRR
jgi:hypothetical protein